MKNWVDDLVSVVAYSEQVVAVLFDLVSFLDNIEFSEKVEGNDGVHVDNDGHEHDGKHEILAVVRDWLEDGCQWLDAHGNVEQMKGVEEVVQVAQDGKAKVPEHVQPGLITESWKKEIRHFWHILSY